MTALDRQALLDRFAAVLDAALTEEEPPRGVPEEILAEADPPPGGDLYSLQAAITALTQEIKLQGRSFKQLSETVEPVAALAPVLESAAREARLQARRETLDALLDLHDRLALGAETARQSAAAFRAKRPWWRKGSVEEAERAAGIVDALLKGYELTAARLLETLQSYGVLEIDCLGRPFDPRVMHAVGVVEDRGAPDGSVVEVCRRGYEWNGAVYRPAQVRVARRIGAAGPQEGEL